nr:uncharacterized protein LOC128705211 [Cherax quadricarinatus]
MPSCFRTQTMSRKGVNVTSNHYLLARVPRHVFVHLEASEPPPASLAMGNNITLMHVHDGTFHPNHENQVDVKFQTGQWFKRVVGRGQAIKSQELANREEIMMVLENMELLLIRYSLNSLNFMLCS